MDISFASSQVRKLCLDRLYMRRRLGPRVAEALMARRDDIAAAANLGELSLIAGARPHRLSGDRAGQFAVDLPGGMRLVFVPAHDPLPRDRSGGLDLSAVTAIEIVEVVDYHG